jgi:signal transduction histidine kinase/CheY-like chemotaxis protein
VAKGHQALRIAEELGDRAMLCEAHAMLSFVLRGAQAPEGAMTHAMKAVRHGRASKMPTPLGHALARLSVCLADGGDLEDALKAALEAEACYVVGIPHHLRFRNLANLVEMHVELRDLRAAQSRQHMLADLLVRTTHTDHHAHFTINGALLAQHSGHLEVANERIQEALARFPFEWSPPQVIEMRENLATNASRLGDFEQAYHHERELRRYIDANARKTQSQQAQEVDAAYDRALLRARSEALQEQNRLLAASNAEAERLRTAAEDAARASRAFLSMMSHEIRTPLHGVLAATELLRREATDLAQRELLDVVNTSGRLTLSVVNDVLEFSKLAAGGLVLDPTDHSLIWLIHDTVALQADRCRAKGLELRLEVSAGSPLSVRNDDHRFQQILLNLVSNAVKFTEHGSVTVRVAPWLSSSVQIEVIDTGIGIEDDALSSLFEPFVQASSDTARRFGGTGLGLAISRQLTECFGGALVARSEVGRGSTFVLRVPIERVRTRTDHAFDVLLTSGDLPPLPRKRTEDEPLPTLDGFVLVVDDNPVNRLVASRMLTSLGLEAALASSGKDALDLVASRPPDLILMDVNMPGMHGPETASTLRDRGYDQPILALTADALTDERHAWMRSGMQGVLLKPLSMADLAAALEPHLVREAVHYAT